MSALKEDVISRGEAVQLGAVNSLFYASHFFPKTARQGTPPMHKEVWAALDSLDRYVDIEIFRGGAKTTLTRLYTSKRIAYGVSRTILYVSNTLSHASRSIQWLMKAVEYNREWADTFQLRKGMKWTGEEIEIIHGVENVTIRVVAVGIEGQVRGLNVDDYRPDLIVCDDPCDEDNTGTIERRQKIADLFFGALVKSLAPSTENPEAKVVLLQTSLAEGDLINMCHDDPQWRSLKFSCFDEAGNSRWPQRFPTETLLADKESHKGRNQLSLWMREMEAKLVADELKYFTEEMLTEWEVLPDGARYYVLIDPTPPLSDAAIKKSLDTDYQAVAVVGLYKGMTYVAEYTQVRDEDDEDLVIKLLGYIRKYRPLAIGVETIAYQRKLKKYLEQKLRERKVYIEIRGIEDRRNKRVRIRQELASRAGRLAIHRTHKEFREQFLDYPQVKHEDILDAVSMISNMEADVGGNVYEGEVVDEGEYEDLPDWRLLPA